MLQRLDDIEKNYEDIEVELANSEVVSDLNKYKELMQKHKELKVVVEKYRDYKKVKKQIDEGLQLAGSAFSLAERTRRTGKTEEAFDKYEEALSLIESLLSKSENVKDLLILNSCRNSGSVVAIDNACK